MFVCKIFNSRILVVAKCTLYSVQCKLANPIHSKSESVCKSVRFDIYKKHLIDFWLKAVHRIYNVNRQHTPNVIHRTDYSKLTRFDCIPSSLCIVFIACADNYFIYNRINLQFVIFSMHFECVRSILTLFFQLVHHQRYYLQTLFTEWLKHEIILL